MSRSPPIFPRSRAWPGSASPSSRARPAGRSIRLRSPPGGGWSSTTGIAPPSISPSAVAPVLPASPFAWPRTPTPRRSNRRDAGSRPRSMPRPRAPMPSPMGRRSTPAVAEGLPLTLHAYRLLTAAATPLAPALMSHRLKRGKELAARLNERYGESDVARPSGPLVWVHGASVGELISVIPLIERISEKGLAVLCTSGTVTSANLAEQRLPKGVIHQFVILDTPRFVKRFFDHWQPDLALFVESDLWPNLIMTSAERGIPLILVNARLSERSFNRWRRVPATIAALLRRFDPSRRGGNVDRGTPAAARRVSPSAHDHRAASSRTGPCHSGHRQGRRPCGGTALARGIAERQHRRLYRRHAGRTRSHLSARPDRVRRRIAGEP